MANFYPPTEGEVMRKAGSSAIRLSVVLPLILLFGGGAMADSSYSLKSPDNRIEIQIHVAKEISYDVLLNNKILLKDSTLAINIDGKTLGENPQVKSSKKAGEDKTLEPVVHQKFAKIRERYNELKLEMDGGYAVTFRAYPEKKACFPTTSANTSPAHSPASRRKHLAPYPPSWTQEMA